LARKILQYASTIEEAYQIAKEHETFVAESFLITSAKDNNMAIIEKTSDNIALYFSGTNQIISTNHYQSKTFEKRQLTIDNIKESDSQYRWNRVDELLKQKEQHNVQSFVNILRNQKGANDKNIGMGNEKAINQLIAHHSIVFKPKQLRLWISVGPYQLGEYLCYDLNKVFSDSLNVKDKVYIDSLTIDKDPFVNSQEFQEYITFKKQTKEIDSAIEKEPVLMFDKKYFEKYINLNPEFYHTYYTVGNYYTALKEYEKAIKYYQIALEKEIPRKVNADMVREQLRIAKELMNK
jgi:tetratricopeptide (TPR) repeat protein